MEELRKGARHPQAHPARAEAADEAVVALAPDTAVEHVYTQNNGEYLILFVEKLLYYVYYVLHSENLS